MRELGLAIEAAAVEASEPPTAANRSRELVLAHLDFIWRLLKRLGVPEADVDDAVQRVFVIGTGRLAEIKPEHERTFLYGTALRVAATIRRDLRRRERWIETRPADRASDAPTPHEELERRQELAFLDELLDALPDDLREIF